MSDEPREPITKEALYPALESEMPIHTALRHGTQALFYEYRHQSSSKVTAPYTLKQYDVIVGGKTYRSMYLIYMRCDSEYEAAIKILGNWSHWQRLTSTKWFSEYITQWEAERNIRDEALARSMLVALVESGNVTAARTVFANSKTHNRKGAGRPEKGGQRSEHTGSSELDEMLGHHTK